MRIELRRTGGFAGLTREVSLDTADLAREQATELEGMAAEADLPAISAGRPSPSRGVDRFTYDLTVEDGEQRHQVQVGDGAIPATLKPLLDRLSAEFRPPRG